MKKLIIILMCLLIVGCNSIMYSGKMEVIYIQKAPYDKDYCLYTIEAKLLDVHIEDKCGKYNIGDKLIITKEIKNAKDITKDNK